MYAYVTVFGLLLVVYVEYLLKKVETEKLEFSHTAIVRESKREREREGVCVGRGAVRER